MPRKKPINPFYMLVGIVGTAFVLTAVAYGVMAYRALRFVPTTAAGEGEHPLLSWMQAHGNTALGVEVFLLIVLTLAAFATESIWERRADDRSESIRAEQTE